MEISLLCVPVTGHDGLWLVGRPLVARWHWVVTLPLPSIPCHAPPAPVPGSALVSSLAQFSQTCPVHDVLSPYHLTIGQGIIRPRPAHLLWDFPADLISDLRRPKNMVILH